MRCSRLSNDSQGQVLSGFPHPQLRAAEFTAFRKMALPQAVQLLEQKKLRDHPELIADDIIMDTPKGKVQGKAKILSKLQ